MFQVQPVQHVYPQVQYVEGGDTVYTNGALYVVPSPSGRVFTENLRPHPEPSFTALPPLCIWRCVCTNPLPILWVVCGSHYKSIRISQPCWDFRNHKLLQFLLLEKAVLNK